MTPSPGNAPLFPPRENPSPGEACQTKSKVMIHNERRTISRRRGLCARRPRRTQESGRVTRRTGSLELPPHQAVDLLLQLLSKSPDGVLAIPLDSPERRNVGVLAKYVLRDGEIPYRGSRGWGMGTGGKSIQRPPGKGGGGGGGGCDPDAPKIVSGGSSSRHPP